MPSSQGYQKVASEPVEPEPVAAKLAAEMSGAQQTITGNPAGKIPATNSQQRLMPADSDSVVSSQDEGDPEAPPGLQEDDDGSGTVDGGSSGIGSVSGKAWFTVAVLCFVNLINYMDRFTIAGE